MSSYYENIKSLFSVDNTERNNKLPSETNHKSDSNEFEHLDDSDCDHDYDKIKKDSIYHNKQSNFELDKANDTYHSIYNEMVEKEQIVRERLDSDLIDKIKENCSEFIDSDVQIIKDFATIMKSFTDIKSKLKEFETNIRNFESDMNVNKLNQTESKSEISTKLKIIESDLEKVFAKVNNFDMVGYDFMEKLVCLENSIKSHEIQRNEILNQMEKFHKEQREIKENNLKILNIFNNFQKFSFFQHYYTKDNLFSSIKIIGGGLFVGFCVKFGLSYFQKK